MVNFIKHIRAVMYKLEADSRIGAYHVSLYWALFQTWNENRFQSPMRIYRDEIMARSKIRTRTAYANYMRELSEWNYLAYDPATRRFEPGLVVMRRFDGTREALGPAEIYPVETYVSGTRPATERVTRRGHVSGTEDRTAYATEHPTDGRTHYINSINNTNIQNDLNANGQAHPTSGSGHDFTPPAENADAEEKKGARGGGGPPEAVPASLDVVHPFFTSLGSTRVEAEKFFHYFSSNGWRVGGRSPMRDWRAAARNWVLNAVRFNPPNGPTPGSLASPGEQNYAEPL